MIYCVKATDPGAPTLSGTAGSLIGVLNYALNLAVGDRGWERYFYDAAAHKLVIRSTDPNANPYAYRLLDSDARFPEWLGYDQTMTDVNTGTNEWCAGRNGRQWMKSTLASTAARSWVIVFDERTIYACIDGIGSGSSMSIYVLGDLMSPRQTDSVVIGNYSLISTAGRSLPFGSFNSVCLARSADGSTINPSNVNFTRSLLRNSTTLAQDRAAPIGGMLVTPMHGISENTDQVLRGLFPGLYYNEQTGAYPTHLSIATLANGRNALIVRSFTSSTSYPACILLDLDGPWR